MLVSPRKGETGNSAASLSCTTVLPEQLSPARMSHLRFFQLYAEHHEPAHVLAFPYIGNTGCSASVSRHLGCRFRDASGIYVRQRGSREAGPRRREKSVGAYPRSRSREHARHQGVWCERESCTGSFFLYRLLLAEMLAEMLAERYRHVVKAQDWRERELCRDCIPRI